MEETNMNKKKLLALLMALVMTFSLVPVTAFAEGEQSAPASANFYVDSENPSLYHIANLAGLKEFRDSVNGGNTYAGKTVQLDAGIDLSEDVDGNNNQISWVPIGNNAAGNPEKDSSGIRFDGSFNGNNYTIRNLMINDPNLVCAGLFGIAQSGEISNLRLNNVDITAKSWIGSVVGFSYSNISNCHVTGTIDIDGHYMQGGIVGQASNNITNCSVDGGSKTTCYITSTYFKDDLEADKIGGIVGHWSNGAVCTISDCAVSNVKISGSRQVGGLVGLFTEYCTMSGCSVSNVVINANAPLEYAKLKAVKIDLGGAIGSFQPFSTSAYKSGSVQVMVQNIDLDVSVSGLESIARMGYVSGGVYYDSADKIDAPTMIADNGITVRGTNSSQAVMACDNVFVQAPGVTPTTTYVAQIGTTKYETLEAAFAAANDGDTINVLADCAGNGIKAPQGKFGTNGLTVNFNGHTYTVDGETVGSTGTETNGFQLLKDNKITFKNGTITSEKAKILVQNYSNLTLQGMTLTLNNPNYTGAYTLSNNNGDIVIDGSTINANQAGGFAFDVCRYASYPSVSVTVQGNSVINGNIEFDAGNGDSKNGISLALNGGTHDGAIILTTGGKNALNAGVNASITKASTFTQAAPEGYTWSDPENGVQTLVKQSPVAKIGDVEYTSLQSAITAAQTGDTINIIADFTIPETNTAESDRIIVNKSVTIDFGEYTMSVPGALGDKTSNNWVGLYIQGIDVNVTLTGTTGGIDCLNYNDGAGAYSFYAKDGATVTVNGGHYHGGGTVGQVAAGTLIINDGYFKVTDYSGEYSGYRYVLNCIDSYYKSGTAKIAVKGGTFENFDPSNCLAEGANTNFVADGYEAVALTGENEGKWQVGKVKATGLTLDTTAQNDNTTATYTATKSVVDEQTNANLLEKPETSFSVTVTAPTENLGSGKESIQLSNININEVVAAAVDKADEQSETNASVVVQLAKDESAQVVVTETTKKVTFEVHPEAIITVEKTGVDSVVTTLPLTNDQITGTFTFKLAVPPALAGKNEKVNVTHKHANGTTENLGAFTVDSDGNITITGIKSFSEFELVSVGDVTATCQGASLRRRVRTADQVTVVNTSTDYRVTFDWTDSSGNNVDVSKSILQWSNNGGNSWHDVAINYTEAVNEATRASVVITGIPSSAFNTTINTRLCLKNSSGVEILTVNGPSYSVRDVADKLSKLQGNNTWSDYGKFLLGTYNIENYTLVRDGGVITGHQINLSGN